MTQAQARSGAIDALLQEDRRYPPPPDFAARAALPVPTTRDSRSFLAVLASRVSWAVTLHASEHVTGATRPFLRIAARLPQPATAPLPTVPSR